MLTNGVDLMLQILLASLLFLVVAPPVSAAPSAGTFDDSEKLRMRHPAWFKESFLDLAEDLREAESTGKKGLMVYFSTEGCSYCRHFVDRSLGAPDIAQRVQEQFDVIGLEIFDDAEMVAPDGRPMRVKEFAELHGAELSPAVVFLNSKGRRLLRIVGYYAPDRFRAVLDYLEGGFHQKESFREYLAKQAGATGEKGEQGGLIKDSLFASPPYALGRIAVPADRPLLVLFERRDCEECTHFHQSVLQDPTIRRILRRFDVVRLDSEDGRTPVVTPGGERATPAAWAERLDLSHSPSLVFFDEAGQQVFKVDSLVLHQRMLNSLEYVLEKAYEQGMTYQRFARSKALKQISGVDR
jgi:thioredoxin-related protein